MKSLLKLLLCTSLLLPSTAAFAADENGERARLMTEDTYEASVGKQFDEEAFLRNELPINEFTNVVVVNKAAKGPGAQTARLYINR